jgi:hypothetical protein
MNGVGDSARAKEFGASAYRDDCTADEYDRRLADLIAEVRADAYEEAVRLCEVRADAYGAYGFIAGSCANAIRALAAISRRGAR